MWEDGTNVMRGNLGGKQGKRWEEIKKEGKKKRGGGLWILNLILEIESIDFTKRLRTERIFSWNIIQFNNEDFVSKWSLQQKIDEGKKNSAVKKNVPLWSVPATRPTNWSFLLSLRFSINASCWGSLSMLVESSLFFRTSNSYNSVNSLFFDSIFCNDAVRTEFASFSLWY